MAKIRRGNFTIEIPEPLQRTNDFYNQDANLLEDIHYYLNSWDKNLEGLTERILDLASYYDEDEINKRIFNNAYVESEQIVRDNLYNIVMMHLLEACIRSVDFNYFQYIEHLQNAVLANMDTLVFISPDIENAYFLVDLNFKQLGKIEDWQRAVQAARDDLNIGMKNNPLASKMWREKIYGTAREGVTIKRYYKKEDTTKDITARYSGKYDITIQARLSHVSSNKAPFWPLLLYGNSVMQGQGGEPYPVFRGYDFITGISSDVKRLFKETYEKLVDRLTEEYRYFINEQNPGYEDRMDTPPDDDILSWADRQLGDIDKEQLFQEKGQRSLERFTVAGYEVHPYITAAGGIGHRVFEIDESGKHKQVKNEVVLALGLSL